MIGPHAPLFPAGLSSLRLDPRQLRDRVGTVFRQIQADGVLLLFVLLVAAAAFVLGVGLAEQVAPLRDAAVAAAKRAVMLDS